MSKRLNAQQIKEVLSIKREDVTADLIKDWFTAQDFTSEPKFSTNDKFLLPANAYFNTTAIETTVGRYLVNFFVFPKKFLMGRGYINDVLTKGKYKSIEGEIGAALMNDEITTADYEEYVNNATWLFLGQAYLLCVALDHNLIIPIDDVIKERDKLFDENAEKLADGDAHTIKKVEDQLMKKAQDELHSRNIASMDYYDSGVADFSNHYKRTAIMVGAIKNPANGKIEMVKSNFTDGLQKSEYGTTSHLSTAGGYARAEGTKDGGYSNKKIVNSTANMELDEEGSDCGTPFTCSIQITNYNHSVLTDRYIVENGKLVLLDEKTIKKYIGKTVNLRTPLYCHGGKICNMCAGNMYYKLATRNIGVHTSTIGGTILNNGMKAFHDATIKFYTLDLAEFIE